MLIYTARFCVRPGSSLVGKRKKRAGGPLVQHHLMQHFGTTQRRETGQLHDGLSTLQHIYLGQGLPLPKPSWSARLSVKVSAHGKVWEQSLRGRAGQAVFAHRLQLAPELPGGCGTPKRRRSQASVHTGSSSLSPSSDFSKTHRDTASLKLKLLC